MKALKYYTILLACLGIASWQAGAQSFQRDMKKVRQVYAGLHHFSCDYAIEIRYDNVFHSDVKIHTTVSDSNYKNVIGDNITAVCGPKYMVTIDQELQVIALARRTYLERDMGKYVSGLADTGFTSSLTAEANGHRTYMLDFASGKLKSMVITIDTATGYISYAEYTNRYKEEYNWRTYGTRKTIITMSNMKTLPGPLPESFFGMQQFVAKKKKQYIALAPYTGYTVLDADL